MIEPKIEELIQLEIDGQNTPEDSRRLWAALEADPLAQAYYERMHAMALELEKLGLVDAPADLRTEIEHRIAPLGRGVRASSRPGIRRSLGRRDLFAFATGIAAGVALFAVLSRDSLPGQDLDPSALSGSMVLNPHAGVLPVVDRHTFEAEQLRADVQVRAGQDFVVAEIELHNPGSLELVLQYDPAVLALVGCERPAAETGELHLGSRELQLEEPKEGPYRFVFRRRAGQSPSPLQLMLERGDWSARESLGTTPPPG